MKKNEEERSKVTYKMEHEGEVKNGIREKTVIVMKCFLFLRVFWLLIFISFFRLRGFRVYASIAAEMWKKTMRV
jgi:hypothetical protein